MNEDRMLDALSRMVEGGQQVTGPYDEQLEALSHDRLDESAHRALLREAEQSPELAAAVEAYSPLTTDFRARMTDRIHNQLASSRAEAETPRRAARRGASETKLDESPTVATVVKGWLEWLWPQPSRLFLVPAVAAAAVALLVFVLPRSPSGLPLYSIELNGGLRTERDGAAAREGLPRLGPGGRLDIVLRPAAAVKGAVAARVFAESGDRLVPLEIPAEVASTGAVRLLVGSGDVDFAPPGTLDLLIVVGRPENLPSADEVGRGTTQGAQWQLLKAAIFVAEGAD